MSMLDQRAATFGTDMMVFSGSAMKGRSMGLPLPKMTLAEYMAWETAQPDRHEFYRGETFAMVGGTSGHNRVVVNLTRRIDAHLDGTACHVFSENMKLQLSDEGCFYPDVMVTCGKVFKGDELAVTEPLLIIEVLSPSTQGYDRRNKFILYRSLASLREYALIDPDTRTVEVFTLTDSGAWLLTDQTNLGTLTLASIDCKLPLEWVFKGMDRDPA